MHGCLFYVLESWRCRVFIRTSCLHNFTIAIDVLLYQMKVVSVVSHNAKCLYVGQGNRQLCAQCLMLLC